jgi:hypothetical protein
VLDSESPAKKQAQLWELILIGIVEPMVLAGLYYLAFTPDWQNLPLLAIPLVSLSGVVLLELSGCWRGTWILDGERLTFRPLRRTEQVLEWARIERVHWRPGQVVRLEEGTTSIKLYWLRFSRAERDQALRFVWANLAPNFDLEPIPPAPPPDGKLAREELDSDHERFVVVAIGALSLSVGVLATTIILAPWPEVEPLARVLRLLLGVFVAWSAICVGLRMRMEMKSHRAWREALRQRHPAWPWRVCRDMSIALAAKKPIEAALADWSV